MNASLLFPSPQRVVESPPPPRREPGVIPARADWDARNFAEEQIRALVRQVFHPGWPKPARHVVFAAIEDDVDLAATCLRTGEVLAGRVEGSVAVIEGAMDEQEFREIYALVPEVQGPNQEGHWSLRNIACQSSERLWVIPPTAFGPKNEDNFAAGVLGNAITRLRQDFDYSVLHAPPLMSGNEAIDMGQMSDGVVMVLRAHNTRRAAARKAKEMLQAANVRVLGTILSGRTFPIPDSIYRNL